MQVASYVHRAVGIGPACMILEYLGDEVRDYDPDGHEIQGHHVECVSIESRLYYQYTYYYYRTYSLDIQHCFYNYLDHEPLYVKDEHAMTILIPNSLNIVPAMFQ